MPKHDYYVNTDRKGFTMNQKKYRETYGHDNKWSNEYRDDTALAIGAAVAAALVTFVIIVGLVAFACVR
jgi:hypothetical protein